VRSIRLRPIPFQSRAVGVAKIASQPGHFRCIDGAVWLAFAVGVASNDPDPVSLVSRINGESRNNKRPRGVAQGFQISEHIVERQRDDPSNVFTNDPSGSRECNNAAHLRPEVAVVFVGELFACLAEWLAGKPPADKIDSSKPTQSVCVKRADIIEAGDARPVLAEYSSTELVDLAERDSAHSCSLESE
jgi:hypothetical protein